MWADRAALVRSDGMGPVADQAAGRWFTPAFRRQDPPAVAVIVDAMRAVDPVGYAGCCEAIGTMDQTGDLGAVTAPTLVIAGAYDTMDPKHMEWMSKQLPKGRFLLCPNAGHMAMYDDGPTYFGGLIKFMRDVDAGTFSR